MNRISNRIAGAFVAAIAIVGFAGSGAFAQQSSSTSTTPGTPRQHAPKHNSNTLTKIGKAIQYSTRKDTENLTTDVHKAEGRKSVARNRKTGNNFVVRPNGSTRLKSTTNPYLLRHKHAFHVRQATTYHRGALHSADYYRHHPYHHRHHWIKGHKTIHAVAAHPNGSNP